MSVVLLHLSDIHIKSDNDPILDRGLAIAACTFSSLPFASHVFIVVTGDIAFSGETFQYALADKFFHDIQDGIKKECGCLVIFVMVPGNHDCNFQRDSGVRKLVVKNLEEQDSTTARTTATPTTRKTVSLPVRTTSRRVCRHRRRPRRPLRE